MLNKLREVKAFKYASILFKVFYFILVLVLVIFLPLICIDLYKGKGFKESIDSALEALKVIGGMQVLAGVAIITFSAFASLIKYALKNKQGKIYQVIQTVHIISLIILMFSGIGFIIIGLGDLFRENLGIFLVVLCAAAFSFYYWYEKKFNN